jgi:uncharacterized protein involved in exopolysaccharide biosynthesis/Mrp family chromosome partitioning ATPase
MYKVHVRRTLFFSILGLLVGLVVAFVSKPIYEARVEMLLGSSFEGRSPNLVFDEEVKKILDRNAPQGVQTERQLLNSETVFFQALQREAPDTVEDFEKLYLMYNVITARTPNQNEQGAGVAQVRVRMYDRQDAINVANGVAEAYDATRRKANKDSIASAIEYLNTQIEAAESALNSSETAYQQYKEETGIAALDKRMVTDEEQRSGYWAAIQGARAEVAGLDDTIAEMYELMRSTPLTVPESSSEVRHPMIDILERELQALEAQKVVMLEQYTETNPKVKILNVALESAKSRLEAARQEPTVGGYSNERKNPVLSQLEAGIAASKARRSEMLGKINALQSSLDEQELRLAETPEMEIKLTQLQRERMIYDEKYRRLKSQLEELTNRRETGTPYAVVLGETGATASERAVAPEPVKLSFIGFIAGACIGLVFSFALESLRPRVYTSGQLADLTGLPVVASIPALPGLTRTKAVESLAKPGGRVLESFRNMAFTYLASGAGQGQTVMFTGIGAAGSSSVGAAQFAVALAQAGTKVILVDAERTRQVITNGFNATDKRGVSNALHDNADASSMLVDTIYDNLRVLPIGTVPEALISDAAPDKIEAMIASLRQNAQIVVVSVAPTDILADAAAFAARVDEVCLNVSARTNEYGTVPMAYDILDKAGAKSIKLILTDTAKEGEPFTSATSIQRSV